MKLLHLSYWIGALADAAMTVAMLYPPLLAAMLGIASPPTGVEVRAALGMGAALMLGWTVLLIWASREPVERSAVLLLTVVPVVAGLALATLYGYATSYIPLRGAASVWIFQALLCVLFVAAYRSAALAAARAA